MDVTIIPENLMMAFFDEVYRHTGVTLDETKKTMLTVRLRRRVRELNLSSFKAYLKVIQDPENHEEELNRFVDVVTTHKTNMFRTPRVWKHLWESALPEFHGEASTGGLRLWSAASSTGEEGASMAIMCQNFQDRNPGFTWSVLATDVSRGTVDQASRQTFDRSKVKRDWAGVPYLTVESHFTRSGAEITLSQACRSRMRFRQHNLFEPLRESRFHIIFLRNVIIYFSAEDKLKVIRECLRVLNPGGLLILGESESLLGEVQGLTCLAAGIYQRV